MPSKPLKPIVFTLPTPATCSSTLKLERDEIYRGIAGIRLFKKKSLNTREENKSKLTINVTFQFNRIRPKSIKIDIINASRYLIVLNSITKYFNSIL